MKDAPRILAKGLVLSLMWGAAWAAIYRFGLGACPACAIQIGITFATVTLLLLTAGVLWLTRSSRGRLLVFLERIRRPTLKRVLLQTIAWILLFFVLGLAAGRAVHQAALLAAGVAAVIVGMVWMLWKAYRRELPR